MHDLITLRPALIITIIMAMLIIFSVIVVAFMTRIIRGLEKIASKTHSVVSFVIVVTICAFWFVESIWYIFAVICVLALLADIFIKKWKVIRGKIKEEQVDYYRDIPCDKDLLKTYYIAYQYGLIKREIDLLGAIILKWIQEKKAKVIDGKNGIKNIELIKKYVLIEWENTYEKQLYQMMYEMSVDGVLEKKELKRWCSNKISKLFSWVKNFMKYEQNLLIESGELVVQKRFLRTKYIASKNLLEEGIKIAGLKKYLKDFTLIKERETVEVVLFEEYLILAQMLGIADKVNSELKHLPKELIDVCKFNYQDYIFVEGL